MGETHLTNTAESAWNTWCKIVGDTGKLSAPLGGYKFSSLKLLFLNNLTHKRLREGCVDWKSIECPLPHMSLSQSWHQHFFKAGLPCRDSIQKELHVSRTRQHFRHTGHCGDCFYWSLRFYDRLKYRGNKGPMSNQNSDIKRPQHSLKEYILPAVLNVSFKLNHRTCILRIMRLWHQPPNYNIPNVWGVMFYSIFIQIKC